MRWGKPLPARGTERVVKRFLWFPTRIGYTVRWLEMAYIRQKFYVESMYGHYYWKNESWEDDNVPRL